MNRYRVTVDGRIYDVEIDDPHARPVTARLAGFAFSVDVEPARPEDDGASDAEPEPSAVAAPAAAADTAVGGPKAMTAPIPGVVTAVSVKAGQTVARGDELVTLDAMKMLNVIRSPWDGTVATVHVATGSKVVQGEPLVTFVPT